MVGNPVPKPSGGFWDHAGEVNDALRGLHNQIEILDGVNDPDAIAALEQAIQAIIDADDAGLGLGI